MRDAASTLTLHCDGRVVLSTRIDTTIGRSSLDVTLVDRRYLSEAQFRLDVDPATGKWAIAPLAGAVNETLLDGAPLQAPSPLHAGQVIAVGNSRKGILKLPMVVSLAPVPGLATPPPAAEPPAHGVTATNTEPGLHAPEPDGGHVSSPGSEEAAAPGWAKTLGAIAGGLLMGALGAAAAGGRGTQVRRGRASYGEVILTVEGAQVYEGRNAYGTPIMTIDGESLRLGAHRWGEVVAHLDGDLVHAGANAWGDVIATLDGEYVREGRSAWGEVIASVKGGRRMAGAAAAAYLLRF